MKKVLFATTALVATAGVAAADVAVTGAAEMGFFGGDGVNESFFTDIDVTFTMSGETDNGLTFGAAVDLDEAAVDGCTIPTALPATAVTCADQATNNDADDGGVAIFVSGDFGRVTLGDTDGALDWALTEGGDMGQAPSLADNHTGHQGYLGSYLDGAYDGQILSYTYSLGDFGIALSVEMDDTGVRDNGYGIGFRYGLDLGGGTLNLGLGYQTATYRSSAAGVLNIAGIQVDHYLAVPGNFNVEVDAIGVSAVYSGNGLTAGVAYTEFDASYTGGTGEMSHTAVGVGYTFDAITVSANWGQFDGSFFPGEVIDETGYGISARYNLGGGLSLQAGYGRSDVGGTILPARAGESQTWSFGVAMSF